jgi:hypothetical protein
MALLALVTGHAEAPSAVREAQLKAAYLYNFTRFVDWPATSFATSSDAIVVGLFGDSGLQADLENTVKDRKVNGRSIVVRRVVTVAEARSVHLLFVEAVDEARFADVLPKLSGIAVLLVGESPQFLLNGGSIRLIVDEQRLRFEINATAAEQAQLRLSAQLQKLAVAVHRSH